MKKYDFEIIKQHIEEHKDIIYEASVGMYEDWFWTAEIVFEDGEYKKELKDGLLIGGIDGSSWATPSLRITFKDGGEQCFPCYQGESTRYNTPPWHGLGVLSEPCQNAMPPLTFKPTGTKEV